MRGYALAWEAHPRKDPWEEGWWDLAGRVGDAIGGLVGAPAGSVWPMPNATLALATVMSCLDLSGRRNRIVTTELDFPSMGHLLHACEDSGAEVVRLPSEDGSTVDAERVAEAVDGRTALVAVSHVSFRTSYRLDPAPLVERARRAGARVCLDVYQSAGIVDLDAGAMGADFLIGGSIKWLCGGPSCGWLYVRPDLHEQLRPALTGWHAHEDPLAFESGPIRYAPGVRRFAAGTPSVPGLLSVVPGLHLLSSVGVPAIAAESRARTRRMIESLRESGWPVRTPLDEARRGGTVVIDASAPAELVERLRARTIFTDWRPGAGVRISPHFFNTDDEVAEVLRVLRELRSSTTFAR
jgi:kynureninase